MLLTFWRIACVQHSADRVNMDFAAVHDGRDEGGGN